MLLMGIDLGTTGVKAAVFHPDGRMAGYGSEEYGFDSREEGWAEQDGLAVWERVKRCMAAAAAMADGEIIAIGLSVQGDAAAPIAKDGTPLAPFQLGMDYRSAPQSEAFSREFGGMAIFQRTGMRPHPMNTLCKIRWFTECEPALEGRVWKYMTYGDFLLHKLGGDTLIDRSMAGRTMGMDLKTGLWSEDLLNAAGITVEQLSTPVDSGAAAGYLDKSLAAELGIRGRPILTAGAHDQVCAALGAGVTQSGNALDSHGTAEVISLVLPALRTDKAMYQNHFPCYPYADQGAYFTFSLNHTAGVLLKWFVEEFCQADAPMARQANERLYEYVCRRTADEPSPLLVLPSFNGSGTPSCDFRLKGVIAGLTLNTSRFDVARAILEALAFDMRLNIGALAQSGIHLNGFRCVGGGARSPIGLQIKADITGLPVSTLENTEAACAGAALLAGRAANVYNGTDTAAEWARVKQVYEPRTHMLQRYNERYEIYQRLASAVGPVLHSL